MIEMDVMTRRKAVAVKDEPPPDYLILGDFGGTSTSPLLVDRVHFDEALSRMDVRVGSMQFHRLDDFHPDRLCQSVPLLRDSTGMPEPEEVQAADLPQPNLEELLRSSSLLEQITAGIDPFQQYLLGLAREFNSPKPSGAMERDTALGERMRSVLHHPRFQAIESAWRGVDFLVHGMEDRGAVSNGGAHAFLAQYSRDDLNRDLSGAAMGPASLRDTRIHQLLSSRRWCAAAGLYHFGPEASDIERLGQLALLAAEVQVPFVSACSLAEGSADMGPYWTELTAMPEAGHLGLVLPRFLLRLPYGARTMPIDSFAFEEMPGVPQHSRYLWGNPALACLSLLARGGALDLTGLPLHAYEKDGEWTTTPCEVQITEVQELALIEAGLMPLVPSATNDCARLAGFRAINGAVLPAA